MNAVPVVALVLAKPGRETTLGEMLQAIVVSTHQEPGCRLYALHRSSENPRLFVFIEKWGSVADLQNHLRSPHIAAALAQQAELIEKLEIIPLSAVAVGDPKKTEF